MNRRIFTFGLGALFAAAPLKVGAMLGVNTQSLALKDQFGTARMMVQSHNRCSPAMLMRHLKLDGEDAAMLQDMLSKRNVISMPNTAGIARAINPTNLHCSLQAGVRVAQPDTGQFHKVTDYIEDRLEAAPECDYPDTSETDAQQSVPARHADTE